jgi:flavin reductase (DIM6/NTAB) family NADH-FMN oxidoreductase RutF
MILTHDAILRLDTRQRAALINSLSGFKSLNLIGSISSSKITNLAIFNSVFHLGANPPLMGFIIRPDSVDRHTLQNILDTGYYTINHINELIHIKAHQTAARYPSDVSEFNAVDLTPEFIHSFIAPFVRESSIKIALKFKERIDVALNGTSIIIGEIQELYFPEECWKEDGYLDIEKAGTIAGSSLDGYHRTSIINRYSYAKPDKKLEIIK